MDQTNMQQTVMEPSEEVVCNTLQPPMESVATTNDNQIILDTNQLLETAVETNGVALPSTSTQETTLAPLATPTYDELFPALPSSSEGLAQSASLPNAAAASQGGGWGAAARNTDNMRVQTSLITQVFHVPQEERAKIDGNNQFGESASSSICAEITRETGAHIEISSAKDHSLTFLVTGKTDEVAKARKLVLKKFQAQNKHTVKIPKEHHKFLLGKKGRRLQELEQTTSTKIQVPSVADPSEVITIIGTKEGIEKALEDIRMMSDEKNKQSMEMIDIPKMYHPFVSGARATALMEKYSVRINVPPINIIKDEITITGEKEFVLECKEILYNRYKAMEKECKTVSVEVPKNQHKYVIGQRGCNIAEILEQHNVSVEMPAQDSPSATITLRGPQENLGGALTMVYAKANSQIQATVTAPSWLHRYIIGRKGANINKVTAEFPLVHVEFSDKCEAITLEGPREDVAKIRENLESMIAEMMSRLKQDQIDVDPKYHKHIIGKAGANINRIRNETNVIINIEPNGSRVIKLEGAPELVEQVKRELEDLVKKMENEKERDITIEYRLHRSIIGTKGEKIREIREQFNQVQISFPDPGEKSDNVKIRGPKDDVDACHKFLQKMVKELLETNFQIKVSIFKQFLRFIIGKGGSNINKIRAETETRIDMSTNDQGMDEMIIIGKKENCEKAKERIQQIQDELANIIEVDIIVPAKFHNSMIGQRGRLIRSISEDCGGVTIKFPPTDKKSDKVTIRGPKEDVSKAKRILVDLSNERQLSSCTTDVRCKVQHHKFLIGKNGATIRKLRDATGARIIFPTERDDDKEVITIIGKKEQVAAAQASLEKTIKELDNIVENFMTVPQKHHLFFIQRRGEVLRQIGDQFGGVSISFPRNGQSGDQVTVKGGVECVAGAMARIQEMVGELESQVSIEVVIAQRHHRTVMGPRGSCIQSVIAEHHVEIKFPERATAEEAMRRDEEGEVDHVRPCDIVRVKGSAENCEGARKALLDLVPVTDQVEVPYHFHRYIIGQRGQSVRALMTTHDVHIQVPPAVDRTDIIKIVGLSSNVESAKQALLEQAGKLQSDEQDKQARSYSTTITVAPEYHPKIIGRKGTVVSKIREKFGVNIQFPQKSDPDASCITITGYEKSCEEAKEAIFAITGDLDSLVKLSFDIDCRVHARLIGQRGRAIRKVMDDFKVSINFARNDDSPDTVIVSGAEANALDCKEHLLNQAEEYLQDIKDKEDMSYYASSRPPPLQFGASLPGRDGDGSPDGAGPVSAEGDAAGVQQQPDPSGGGAAEEVYKQHQQQQQQQHGSKPMVNGRGDAHHMANGGVANKQGFVVSGAPWAQEAPNVNSSEDFPSMGATSSPTTSVMSSAWGPRR